LLDTRWNIKLNQAKAIMLAKRKLAEFVCDAVNLEGINFTLPEIQISDIYDRAKRQLEFNQLMLSSNR